MNQRVLRPAAKAGALALLALSPLLGSCASTGSSPDEVAALGAVRASIVQYPGVDFILVNDTYAERQAGTAVESGTKVTTDEVLGEVARYFGEVGFWDHARPGLPPQTGDRRPTEGGREVVLAVAYSDDTRSGWLPMRAGLTSDETAILSELVSNMTALWNSVEGYHAVFNPQGESVFQQPTYE